MAQGNKIRKLFIKESHFMINICLSDFFCSNVVNELSASRKLYIIQLIFALPL